MASTDDKKTLEQRQRKLLKEFVLSVLKEDDGGGEDYSGALSGIQADYQQSFGPGGGGGEYGGSGGLKAAFIDPFMDIVKTGLWGIEKLTTRAKNFLQQLIIGAIPLIVPVIKLNAQSYREMIWKEKAELKSVDDKYKDVLERNKAAIQDADTWLVLFMIDPAAGLGEKLLEKVPGAVEDLLATFTGIDLSRMFRQGNDHIFHGLNEDDKQADAPEEKLSKDELKILLKDKNVQQKLASSPIVKQMQQDGAMLMVAPVKRMLAAKTAEELNQLLSGALTKTLAAIAQNQFTPEEKQVMVGNVMSQAKKAAVDNITKEMQGLASQHPAAKAAIDAALASIQQK